MLANRQLDVLSQWRLTRQRAAKKDKTDETKGQSFEKSSLAPDPTEGEGKGKVVAQTKQRTSRKNGEKQKTWKVGRRTDEPTDGVDKTPEVASTSASAGEE